MQDVKNLLDSIANDSLFQMAFVLLIGLIIVFIIINIINYILFKEFIY